MFERIVVLPETGVFPRESVSGQGRMVGVLQGFVDFQGSVSPMDGMGELELVVFVPVGELVAHGGQERSGGGRVRCREEHFGIFHGLFAVRSPIFAIEVVDGFVGALDTGQGVGTSSGEQGGDAQNGKQADSILRNTHRPCLCMVWRGGIPPDRYDAGAGLRVGTGVRVDRLPTAKVGIFSPNCNTFPDICPLPGG